MAADSIERLRASIRDVPNFPKHGIIFKDITPILNGWDHDPDELQVRIITGVDGRDKIQMRIDLGLVQMELDGHTLVAIPHGPLQEVLRKYNRLALPGGPGD